MEHSSVPQLQSILDFIFEAGRLKTVTRKTRARNTAVQAAELAAVTRIFGLLSLDRANYFLTLWNEFEHEDTP